MQYSKLKCILGITASIICLGFPAIKSHAEEPQNGWYEENGSKYWYENGIRQGLEGRGKEIYDPASDAWYWLDAAEGGKMAVGKDVFQESDGGKWVRYDENGHMIKVWNSNENGVYYFDMVSGAMYKGDAIIDGIPCSFDIQTGVGINCIWHEVDGAKYWYENGVRQGLEGRGKEIYDPASDAWYWLDAVDGGRMAVSKDVYQESNGGKWVRYDSNGHMIKGENEQNGDWYRFDDVTGAMIKGWYTTNASGQEITYYYNEIDGKMVKGSAIINGKNCRFDVKTGAALDLTWYEENGAKYWYEKGVRQGMEGRGKEIYDPSSDAWYWLDAVDNGKMAVSKDVFQESDGGKWVRYDENGRMIKGWSSKNGNRYYFDPVTGAMAKGIVRINGTDYSFDENTGIYKGVYEGGEVSYSWVKTRETRLNSNDSMLSYILYDYTDNGALERERVYNQNRRILTEEKYEYSDDGNVTSHSYRNYTDSSLNYTEYFIYENNLLIQETKQDKNGSIIETKKHTYTGSRLIRTDIYDDNNSLAYYYTYNVDGRGNITRANSYNKQNVFTGYTTNSYYEYNGQSFLRLSLVYTAENNIVSGESYVRNGYELKEEIIYTNNREVKQRTKYETNSFPDENEETVFQRKSYTYDNSSSLMYYSVYDYELMEFLQ